MKHFKLNNLIIDITISVDINQAEFNYKIHEILPSLFHLENEKDNPIINITSKNISPNCLFDSITVTVIYDGLIHFSEYEAVKEYLSYLEVTVTKLSIFIAKYLI